MEEAVRIRYSHKSFWIFYLSSTRRVPFIQYTIHRFHPTLIHIAAFTVYMSTDTATGNTIYFVLDDYQTLADNHSLTKFSQIASGLMLTPSELSNSKENIINVTYLYTDAELHMHGSYQLVDLNQTDLNKSMHNQWRMCRLGRCYMVKDDTSLPQNTTWQDAEDFCRSHNGHLLSANSNSEELAVWHWLIGKRRVSDNSFNGFSTLHLRASMIYIGLHISEVSINSI